MVAATVMECPHCRSAVPPGRFCRACRRLVADPTGTVELVTYNRRFWGDDLLEGVLAIFTLIIGWFIWLIFTARNGQTPAKSLLNVYILDKETGTVATAGKVWLREVLVKIVLLLVANAIIGVAGLVDAIWVFFDRDRQALHDKIAGTLVVYAPVGVPNELRPPLAGTVSGPALGGPYPRPAAPPSPTPPPPAAEAGEIAERLRELARLHQDGILTDEEYERKRQELADKL